jgi:hypothetical protein
MRFRGGGGSPMDNDGSSMPYNLIMGRWVRMGRPIEEELRGGWCSTRMEATTVIRRNFSDGGGASAAWVDKRVSWRGEGIPGGPCTTGFHVGEARSGGWRSGGSME